MLLLKLLSEHFLANRVPFDAQNFLGQLGQHGRLGLEVDRAVEVGERFAGFQLLGGREAFDLVEIAELPGPAAVVVAVDHVAHVGLVLWKLPGVVHVKFLGRIGGHVEADQREHVVLIVDRTRARSSLAFAERRSSSDTWRRRGTAPLRA